MGPKESKNQTSKEREIPLPIKIARGSRETLYKKNGDRITGTRAGFPYYRQFGTSMLNFRKKKWV